MIDINFPQHHITAELNKPFNRKSSEETLSAQTKELLCYIWDNYLETNSNASVSILSVGDCYTGVKQLLTSRGAISMLLSLLKLIISLDTKAKVPAILAFLTGTLRPIRSETDIHLSAWYKNNSLIYVSPDHACWSDEESAKKVRKRRFGHVEKSTVTGLRNMLFEYKDDGLAWLASQVAEWEGEGGSEEGSGEEAIVGRMGGGGREVDMQL